MIPLRDTLLLRRRPWVTWGLILLNVVMFIVQAVSGARGVIYVRLFGFIPARLLRPEIYQYSIFEAALTLLTSLFLHGGYLHLIGNMLYLNIFGDNVEDELGHVRYLIFYLVCGVFGSLTHTMLFPLSKVPSIGASGCIAGILGAFFVLHFRARIITLIPLVVSYVMVELPALVFLPLWFGIQFLSGWLALASTVNVQETSGIAWWTHVGGFLFGAVVIFLFHQLRRRRLPREQA